MTDFKGCDKCNRSSLSLLLLRPSPVSLDTQPGLAMDGVNNVMSDLTAMKGLLPSHKMTQSRYVMRFLRPGYVHVYYKNPVAGASDWQVFRVTNDADLIPESSPLFARADADLKCTDEQHNPSGLKLLNIPQAHKVDKIWIAFSANLWSDKLRAKNKENPAVMQQIVLAGGSPNTLKPSAANLRQRVLECGIDRWTVWPHEFPFVSLTPRNKMNPGNSVNLVDHLAAELTRAAAAHPATKGKEMAVVLRDPVGIAAELNYLRIRRGKLVLTELSKPEIAHPYNSSAALMGMQDKFVELSTLKAFDAVSPIRERSSVSQKELDSGAEWVPLSEADKKAMLDAIPAHETPTYKWMQTEKIKESGRLVHPNQNFKEHKWVEAEKEKLWAKLKPYYDEEKRAAWMAAHEERMQREHYDHIEEFEMDWYSATEDVQTKSYFAEHFDPKDPNDPKKSHSPGGAYAAESHRLYFPQPESKGKVLEAYLGLLSEDIHKASAVLLRATVFNQEDLFDFVYKNVTGDPGDTGMRDKFFDIFKELKSTNKKISWLNEGYAFFGVGQMTALAAASLSGVNALLKNTPKGRHIVARVKQLSAVHQAIDLWRQAAQHGALRNGAPKVPVLLYKSVDRVAAFAAMRANPGAFPGMTKQEVYNHTKNNQKIQFAILTDTDAIRAAGGSIEEVGKLGNAVDLKFGVAATTAVAASEIKLSESQALRLIAEESSKTTVAVNALRSTFSAGHRTGINEVFISIDGRLAIFTVVVQIMGIYYTSLTVKSETNAQKLFDAQLAMADSVAGATGGLMQILAVAVEAHHRANAPTAAVAESAIQKSGYLTTLRFTAALAGVAGGAINAYAMVLQAKRATDKGNTAVSDLYVMSAFMFAGTAVASAAVGAGVVAAREVAKGTASVLVRNYAARGAEIALLRVAGATVLTASGIGWAFLILGVGAQLTAVALTPSDLQRWVGRSYFGRDRDLFGRPAGRRLDSFPRGKWQEEKDGLALAMREAARENEKFLASVTATQSPANTK